MKTPREILLERHKNVAPKLDAIRCECVGQASSLSRNKMSETGKMPVLLLVWRELIFPSRRIWTSLAAIWIFIFIVNFSMRDRSEVALAKIAAPSSQMILAQERLLAELTETEPRIAEPAKTFSPRPSSERKIQIVTT